MKWDGCQRFEICKHNVTMHLLQVKGDSRVADLRFCLQKSKNYSELKTLRSSEDVRYLAPPTYALTRQMLRGSGRENSLS